MKSILEKLVNDIHEIYDVKVPIDINEVVEKIGGSIEYTENRFKTNSIIKTSKGFIISIVHKKDKYLEKISIAQAIATLFLIYGYRINPDRWNNKEINEENLTLEQINAINYFSYAFLMPKNIFTKVVEENTVDGYVKMKKVAEYFDVSVSQVFCRGKDIGIFKHF